MLSLIAAVARNRVIGRDNRLLWHLPGDMRHFRETTRDRPVIMGRRTWESLPARFRPLPGRPNVVVSRNPDYAAPGAARAGSLIEAIEKAGSEDEIFVIGGAELYRQALPFAERLYLTEIAAEFPGDALFPEIDARKWREVSRGPTLEETGLTYAFAVYEMNLDSLSP
ncbi:MAG: dihydrofolate reductase [Candidatus Accumulibacter sp.]|jgi:dihydrofolate reductase|nr:dihydrofolate reductase [Accumulibacter sp.]